MNDSTLWIPLGFVLGVLFLASIYPIILDQYTCPDFLSIETCEMSTYHALVVDVISTSIFTAILAIIIFLKTKKSTREAIRVEMGSLTDQMKIDVGRIG